MSSKNRRRALERLLYDGPIKDPAILKAASRLHAIRERAKRLKKRLKDREDHAGMLLWAALEDRGLEACKIGPYLIMADVKTKIQIKKKLERTPERRPKPGGKG